MVYSNFLANYDQFICLREWFCLKLICTKDSNRINEKFPKWGQWFFFSVQNSQCMIACREEIKSERSHHSRHYGRCSLPDFYWAIDFLIDPVV